MTTTPPCEPLTEAEITEIHPIIKEIAIFAGLEDDQLNTLFHQLQKTKYEQGDFIFEVGDHASHIFIVWTGRVELVLDIGGAYLAKNIFHIGDCIGETAAIGIEPHAASAVVLEPTKLIVLSRKALFGFWDTDKALFGMLVLNIAREACRRLNQSDRGLLQYFTNEKKHLP